jgi:hypothetical protein
VGYPKLFSTDPPRAPRRRTRATPVRLPLPTADSPAPPRPRLRMPESGRHPLGTVAVDCHLAHCYGGIRPLRCIDPMPGAG